MDVRSTCQPAGTGPVSRPLTSLKNRLLMYWAEVKTCGVTVPPLELKVLLLDSAFCLEATTVKSARPTWPVTLMPKRPDLLLL